MSCGCDDSYNSYPYGGACRADVPYPQVSHESVPSLIDNLATALYGGFYNPATNTGYITKSVVNGRIVWSIPCDPNNTSTINNIPRNSGEGLLCYIMRALNLTISNTGFVTVNGTQTLTNKTLDITCTFAGNAATATSLLAGVAGAIPYQSAAGTTGFNSPGTAGQLLVSGGTGAPVFGVDHIGASSSTSTPPSGGASGYVGELLTWTSSATAITTGQTLNVLSLSSASSPSFTSGDWKFYGVLVFACTGTSIAALQTFTGGFSTTSATTAAGKRFVLPVLSALTTSSFSTEQPLAVTPILQPASGQTVYVVATAPAFTAGSMTVTAYVSARRMR